MATKIMLVNYTCVRLQMWHFRIVTTTLGKSCCFLTSCRCSPAPWSHGIKQSRHQNKGCLRLLVQMHKYWSLLLTRRWMLFYWIQVRCTCGPVNCINSFVLQELPTCSCHMRLGIVVHLEEPRNYSKDFILIPNA